MYATMHNKRYQQKCKSIKVSSLTCLFVYKVLNQEVLDDRGNLQLSDSENESIIN